MHLAIFAAYRPSRIRGQRLSNRLSKSPPYCCTRVSMHQDAFLLRCAGELFTHTVLRPVWKERRASCLGIILGKLFS